MNKTRREVIDFLDKVGNYNFSDKNTVIIAPTNPYLYLFEQKLRYSKVMYGVQNFYPKDSGAFTGEISIKMAKDFGCKYAIVGHSERRNIFFECDEFISKKVKETQYGKKMNEETYEDYKQLLIKQIREDLGKISGDEFKEVIIAYEPIWAIGTGETATPEQVEETHVFLRKFLIDEYGEKYGRNIPLLYGGSVKPENVKELALADGVSGFLIGGASLKADSFIEINLWLRLIL